LDHFSDLYSKQEIFKITFYKKLGKQPGAFETMRFVERNTSLWGTSTESAGSSSEIDKPSSSQLVLHQASSKRRHSLFFLSVFSA
jgi:hypothetical protein